MNSLHHADAIALAEIPTLDIASADLELIHRISTELIGEHDLKELYGKVVEAAIAIMGSQFGTMQRLCPFGDASGHGGELQLLAQRGLPSEAIDFWEWVSPTALSSCTVALKYGHRAIIPDFEMWEDIADTQDLLAFRRAGIRSAQTTPLLSRHGVLLGMISTHWTDAHQPTERDLRLLDILARQAADLLERTIAEDELRARKEELEVACAALRESQSQQRQIERTLRQLNETLEVRVEERSRELMAAAEQVRHMQKMEAIGQLTGGVAHDFNNLLTIIRASAELLSRPELPVDRRQRYATAISDTADRAAKLTGQLLAFARRQALRPEVFEAAGRVKAIGDMLRTIIGSRIELSIEQPLDDCFIEVDASQFETALVNMAVNARDAMNGEGRLAIQIGLVGAVPPVRGHAGSVGCFVKISVVDTGSGMSSAQIEHVFEPFFTTKALGKGTGLGLSQVYGFIKQSGGEVDVESRVGEGTTFSIYLPHVAAPALIDDCMVAPAAATSGVRVLVVEDNEQVRIFAAELLQDLGYRTRCAANANEALAILETDSEAIDVVFSDVVMPGVDGVELARTIRARWPGMKLVLTSGYSHVLADDAKHGFQLLHKPYSADELARALNQVHVARV